MGSLYGCDIEVRQGEQWVADEALDSGILGDKEEPFLRALWEATLPDDRYLERGTPPYNDCRVWYWLNELETFDWENSIKWSVDDLFLLWPSPPDLRTGRTGPPLPQELDGVFAPDSTSPYVEQFNRLPQRIRDLEPGGTLEFDWHGTQMFALRPSSAGQILRLTSPLQLAIERMRSLAADVGQENVRLVVDRQD